MKFDTHPEQKAIDAKMSELFRKYVPMSGNCDTVGGEIVRAMSRIGYRYYNDGDMAHIGYGRKTVNPACRYLANRHNLKLRIWDDWVSEAEYDYTMYVDFKDILAHLDEHPELFEEKNDEDYLDWYDSDEDRDYDDEDEREEDYGEDY